MRTPNSSCEICGKPLYRRPYELAKARYVACMEHRAEAQRRFALTDAQQKALCLGRQKGTNHLEGIPKSAESNLKRSIAHKKFCSEHPDKVKARGEKVRGENHYNWKGGISKIGVSIRRMTEFRKWSNAIIARDAGKCTKCSSTLNLEAHHLIPVSEIISKFSIRNREDARNCSELWDLDNGSTLCEKCHYEEHDRTFTVEKNNRTTVILICLECGTPFKVRPSRKTNAKFCSKKCSVGWIAKHPKLGSENNNWKGGKVTVECRYCGKKFPVKPAKLKSGGGKFCSMECKNESQRKYLQ